MFNPYVLLAALIGFIVATGGAYLKGYNDADQRAELAQMTEERNNLLQLWETAENARQADAQRLAHNEALLRDLQDKAEADAHNLQDGDSVCFAPADADLLRQHFRTPR